MPDNAEGFVLDALRRATANPTGLPLFGNRSEKGLFDNSRPAKIAAKRAVECGFFRIVEIESIQKPGTEKYKPTESGLKHLFDHSEPAHILVALVRAINEREAQFSELGQGVRAACADISGLRKVVETVLARLGIGGGAMSCRETLLEHLSRWQMDRPAEDCPLPELCRLTRQAYAGMSLGQFHDALRMLHEDDLIYLHPWTGPLYDLPEPAFALLAGHEIVYYASIRGPKPDIRSQRSEVRTASAHSRV